MTPPAHDPPASAAQLLRLRPQRWMAWVALFLGIALSIFLWHATAERTRQLADSRFAARAGELHGALAGRLDAYSQILRGAHAYIDVTGHPDRKRFAHLYRTLRIGSDLPGLSTFAYIRHVHRDDRSRTEAEVRRDYPDFSIRPPGERDEYAVVTGVESQTPMNLRAIGSDSYANAERREALDAARDSGDIRITAKLHLVIDDPDKPRPAFLMYQAIYRGSDDRIASNGIPETLAERQRLLSGFVLGAFRIDTLVAGTFAALPGDIAFRIYDGPSPAPEQLYYASHPEFDFGEASFTRSTRLAIGGREWRIDYAGLPAFDEEVGNGTQARRPLLAGLLVSLLLFAIVWTLATTRASAVDLARKMTHSLAESETKLRALFDQAPVGIWLLDHEARVIDCNDKFAEYAGAARDRIIGFPMLGDPRDAALNEPIRRALAGETVKLEAPYRSTLGNRASVYSWHFQPIAVDDAPAFVLCFVEDISARKMAEAHIEHLAHHDTLTGLANRALLKDRLQQAISAATRTPGALALFFIDLDFFTNINDTVGHSAGDALLIEIAGRLRRCVRNSDTLARIGGDEFVILLTNIGAVQDCIRVAEAVIAEIATPVGIEAHTFNVTGSIGIAVWPGDGEDSETLTRNADVAMYHAKQAGRNNYQFFTADMNARAHEMAAMESSLREALAREQFVLHYQPQVDGETGAIIGAEALIRWQHPELGLLYPDRFVDIAEARGLIASIGRWVLFAACRQMQAWRAAGHPALCIAVNISPIQLRKDQLLYDVADALRDSGLPPQHLALEVTEGAVMEDVARATHRLQEIRQLGVMLEIDDFGTGHSSLAYLKQLPIQRLKIDRSFVRGIPGDADDTAIVGTIVTLAGSLKREVIAEGVETDAQRRFLLGLGCTAMQGYHFSRPLPAAGFATLLAGGKGIIRV